MSKCWACYNDLTHCTCGGKSMIGTMSDYYDYVFLGVDKLPYDQYFDLWLSDIWCD